MYFESIWAQISPIFNINFKKENQIKSIRCFFFILLSCFKKRIFLVFSYLACTDFDFRETTNWWINGSMAMILFGRLGQVCSSIMFLICNCWFPQIISSSLLNCQFKDNLHIFFHLNCQFIQFVCSSCKIQNQLCPQLAYKIDKSFPFFGNLTRIRYSKQMHK